MIGDCPHTHAVHDGRPSPPRASLEIALVPVVFAAFAPFGLKADRRNIDVLIDYMFGTKMIPRRYSVDEFFNDVTRKLA